MLAVARGKGVRETVWADALQLPFEAESFEEDLFAFAAATIVGKRLTYKALIGKEMLES